ncbi:MAG: rod shape-determining protein MreC [Candidatus Buchananbacteria bacterium]
MLDRLLKSLIYSLAAILIAVFFHYLGWLSPVENLFILLLKPLQSGAYELSQKTKNFSDYWLRKRNIIAENQKLIEEIKQLSLEQSKIKSLEEENSLLKKELNFIDEDKKQFVAARIITGVSDPLSQTVIIDRGAKDGIVKGLAVSADRGVLVGKISEVFDDYSKVTLLSDNKSRVAATVQNLDHTVGLVEGQYGLSFAMTNIPQNQDIRQGDLVVTSGLEGQIPKDLLIAKVESVKTVESEIFKTAILQPIIPLSNLSYVVVIIP